jgi:signal transduction histidine kinase
LLSIIVNNILTNAIKYSKQKDTIHFEIVETTATLVCTITDTGIGITAEDLQKIFDQFYRSKSNDHPEIKGTGLGLSIVKRLCLLLQIELQIESKENEGTKVILGFQK